MESVKKEQKRDRSVSGKTKNISRSHSVESSRVMEQNELAVEIRGNRASGISKLLRRKENNERKNSIEISVILQ